MYDQYIIQYVVTVWNNHGDPLSTKYFFNEESAVKEARRLLNMGYSIITIVQHSELTGWEE